MDIMSSSNVGSTVFSDERSWAYFHKHAQLGVYINMQNNVANIALILYPANFRAVFLPK